MFVIIKHLILSISTAINLSKEQGISSFFRIFNIRFFYGFNFFRNFFGPNKSGIQNVTSSNYFIKNIKSNKIVNDLDKYGYNDFLKIKSSYLNNIKKEITLKNSSIAFKGKKKSKSLFKSLSFKSLIVSVSGTLNKYYRRPSGL